MKPAFGVITSISYGFRESTGVIYLVRGLDFLQCHMHCQVSYHLTKTRFAAMSHTLSGVKPPVTYLQKRIGKENTKPAPTNIGNID